MDTSLLLGSSSSQESVNEDDIPEDVNVDEEDWPITGLHNLAKAWKNREGTDVVKELKYLLDKGAETDLPDENNKGRTPIFVYIGDSDEHLRTKAAPELHARWNLTSFLERQRTSEQSALNLIRKQLPFERHDLNLRDVFDKAITQESNGTTLEVKIDFKCIVPQQRADSKIRAETAKVKSLMDENFDKLLDHPLIQAFVDLKWEKARNIFWLLFILKCILVVLVTYNVYFPYYTMRGNTTSTGFISFVSKSNQINEDPKDDDYSAAAKFAVYCIILFLMLFVVIVDVIQLIRIFSWNWRLIEVMLNVVLIVFSYFFVKRWYETIQFDRTVVAVGILFFYMGVWAHLGRFLAAGHSVRIYIQVFERLLEFIWPQFILIIGFALAFALIFPDKPGFEDFFQSAAKTLLVMSGEMTYPGDGKADDSSESSDYSFAYFAKLIMLYIFTLYALMIGVVLINTMIALAVDDTKKLRDGATLRLLKRKITLLNAMEASLIVTNCVPAFIKKWISLCHERTIFIFRPFDETDKTLAPELKKLLIAQVGKPNFEDVIAQLRRSLDVLEESVRNHQTNGEPHPGPSSASI